MTQTNKNAAIILLTKEIFVNHFCTAILKKYLNHKVFVTTFFQCISSQEKFIYKNSKHQRVIFLIAVESFFLRF